MEADFAEAIASWAGFYDVLAGVAATLMGLLFVSLAISPRMMSDRGAHGVRVWSEQTFHSFLVLLVLALITLIPEQSALGMGIPLTLIGIQGLFRVIRDVRVARQDPNPVWRRREGLTRFGAPALAYLFCLWAAMLAFQSDADAMGWLVAVTFLLMMSALGSCWELLKGIGDRAGSAGDAIDD